VVQPPVIFFYGISIESECFKCSKEQITPKTCKNIATLELYFHNFHSGIIGKKNIDIYKVLASKLGGEHLIIENKLLSNTII